MPRKAISVWKSSDPAYPGWPVVEVEKSYTAACRRSTYGRFGTVARGFTGRGRSRALISGGM
jgi:hypothetical protein